MVHWFPESWLPTAQLLGVSVHIRNAKTESKVLRLPTAHFAHRAPLADSDAILKEGFAVLEQCIVRSELGATLLGRPPLHSMIGASTVWEPTR